MSEHPEVRVIGGTVVRVYETWTQIVLPNGAVVNGCPTRDQFPTARDLGYGEDITAMCLDHDPMHVALCDLLGIPMSYSLRKASGENISGEEDMLAGLEEDAVLAVLRLRMAHKNKRRPA